MEQIDSLWRCFVDSAPALARADSADDAAYEALLCALHKVHEGLYLEFSADHRACELVVTAEGERSLFPLVREIVDSAPIVQGWKIVALKPKLGLPKTTTWNGYVLDVSTVVFDPLRGREPHELGLCIYVPNLDPDRVEDAHNALLRALDHALGEEKFAESIHFTEVQDLPDDAEPGEFIPLRDIERYLAWHQSRFAAG